MTSYEMALETANKIIAGQLDARRRLQEKEEADRAVRAYYQKIIDEVLNSYIGQRIGFTRENNSLHWNYRPIASASVHHDIGMPTAEIGWSVNIPGPSNTAVGLSGINKSKAEFETDFAKPMAGWLVFLLSIERNK